MAKKLFDVGGRRLSSGFYGLSNTKKGIKSTFNATMKQNLKRLKVNSRRGS